MTDWIDGDWTIGASTDGKISVAEALYAIAEGTQSVYLGVLQAGTTDTILVDDLNPHKPGALIGGTAFVLTGTYAQTTRRISAASAGRLTISPVLAGAPEVNSLYAVCGPKYPRAALLQGLNSALRGLGDITLYDETLVSVSGQIDYTLPTGVNTLVGVEVARWSVAPYEYKENFHWKEIEGGKLRFLHNTEPDESGLVIRLAYNRRHPAAFEDGEILATGVSILKLKWQGAAEVMRTKLGVAGKPAEDDPLVELINEAKDQADKAPDHHILRLRKPLMLPGW